MADRSPRVPRSTYRLQITADFDLFEAARHLPYLHDLGADWVYLSPILAAEPGSTHGYDVVAHDRVDASRGGSEGLAALADEAHRLGLGVLVDVVPNHVGVATPPESAWWWELLRDGPGSPAADRFDVDWEAGDGKVLIPVLGDDDDDAIEVRDGEVRYHDNRYPLAPGTSTLAEQHYELVSWRRGDAELNYRRFFTISTLAAVRVEDPTVFADSHAEIRRWFDEGLVDGLRIDHPDGLRDPEGYLRDLAGLTGGAYTLVEKILEPGEQLDAEWPCEGTTGYDALGVIDRVLTDPAGEGPLTDLETRLRGAPVDFAALTHDQKRAVADGALLAETRRIVRDLGLETGLGGPPQPAASLEDAVAELLACFPVYRSYLPHGVEHLDEAFTAARQHRPDLAAAYDVLVPVLHDPAHPAALRFQQTSGMVMAKGVEDCSFYRCSRLTSLNEVGGDPSHFALTPAELHGWAARRQHEWPDAMNALTTHDTKRSEDTRARITALAEVPALWAEAMDELQRLAPMPDAGFASLVWQAAVGAWPISRERLSAYAEKAMREAGDHTTWTDQDEAYEAGVHGAIDAAYDEPAVTAVIQGVVDTIEHAGRSNALAAKLLAITLPGVPDVYQGTELGDFSLVDPDNRRLVDLDTAARSLADGSNAKQQLTAQALRLRRDRPELFTSYDAVTAEGPAADHLLAFDRGGVITLVTRLPLGLAARGGWGDTVVRLPGGTTRVEDVLGDRGAALVVHR